MLYVDAQFQEPLAGPLDVHGSGAWFNARIMTMQSPTGRASAICWEAGRIVAVGDDQSVQSVAKRLRIIPEDLQGRVVLPGFVDAHTHFLHVGIKHTRPDLRGCPSVEELRSRVRSWLVEHPGTGPVIAEGWDEADWKGTAPTIEDADAVSLDAPDGSGGTTHRPLVLRRICGHKAVANTTALPLVIDRWGDQRLPSAPGDEDHSSAHGVAREAPLLVDSTSGVLLEQPSLYLNEVMPVDEDGLDHAVQEACTAAHRLGVTTVGDYSQAPYRKALLRAARQGLLSVRVASSIYVQQLDEAIADGFRTGCDPVASTDADGGRAGGPWIRDAGLKVFHDGSFGGRTAYLREPYKDDPTTRGEPIWSNEQVRDLYRKAAAADIQLHAHAIGDAAIDQALDGFAALQPAEGLGKAAQKQGPAAAEADLTTDPPASPRELRHRIEHYELPHDDAVERTARLGAVASCQPNFVGVWSSKGGMYEDRLGPVFLLNNRYRTFKEAGIRLAFGSDGMPFGPLVGLAAAISHPVEAERLSIEEAIWHYTNEAAWSLHWDDAVGRLERGLCADMVVLDQPDLDGDPRQWILHEVVVAGIAKGGNDVPVPSM